MNHAVTMLWQTHTDVAEILETAAQSWRAHPMLTTPPATSYAIWKAMLTNNERHREIAQSGSAYKIMELIGQSTAHNQWSPECALSCYRATLTMEDLSGEEYSILDELHSKLTRDKSEEETQRIMAFWQKLDDYRTRSLQRSGDGNMTGSQMIEQFKWDVLWWDLSYDDQKSKQCRSNLTKSFHRKSAWKHAAAAIMDDGLPKLRQPH